MIIHKIDITFIHIYTWNINISRKLAQFSKSTNKNFGVWCLSITRGHTVLTKCLCYLHSLFLRYLWVLGWSSNVATSLDKETVGCNSPYNWLMNLAVDLAALCDVWRWKMVPVDTIWFFYWWCSLCLILFPPPFTLYPYNSACDIGYTNKQIDTLITKNQALQILYLKHHV